MRDICAVLGPPSSVSWNLGTGPEKVETGALAALMASLTDGVIIFEPYYFMIPEFSFKSGTAIKISSDVFSAFRDHHLLFCCCFISSYNGFYEYEQNS